MCRVTTSVFVGLLVEFFKKKRGVVRALRCLASELNVKQRDMNIAKTSFAASGIVGAGLAIAGAIAAPFTFGASLGLTIAGVAVSVSSGVGGVATTIADHVINSKTMKEARAATSRYDTSASDLMQEIRRLSADFPNNEGDFDLSQFRGVKSLQARDRKQCETILRSIRTGIDAGGQTAHLAATIGTIAAKTATVTARAGKAVATAAGVGLKAARIGGAVLSVLTVPIDLHILVTNSIKIHKKTPSDVAEQILELAQKLEDHNILGDATGFNRSIESQNYRQCVTQLVVNENQSST